MIPTWNEWHQNLSDRFLTKEHPATISEQMVFAVTDDLNIASKVQKFTEDTKPEK